MRRDEVLAKLKAELPDLRARFAVKSLGLFGSVARGDDRPDSDVDVLVEFEGGPTLARYFDLQETLQATLGCRVDLITVGSLTPRFKAEVEGELVRVA